MLLRMGKHICPCPWFQSATLAQVFRWPYRSWTNKCFHILNQQPTSPVLQPSSATHFLEFIFFLIWNGFSSFLIWPSLNIFIFYSLHVVRSVRELENFNLLKSWFLFSLFPHFPLASYLSIFFLPLILAQWPWSKILKERTFVSSRVDEILRELVQFLPGLHHPLSPFPSLLGQWFSKCTPSISMNTIWEFNRTIWAPNSYPGSETQPLMFINKPSEWIWSRWQFVIPCAKT